MRYLVVLFSLWIGSASAFDRITPDAITQLLNSHSTSIIQKDSEKLMALFADNYQQSDKTTPKAAKISKAELKKIYNGNFMVAKLILNTISLTDSHIAENAQSAQIKTHIFTRYLIEYAEKQNILTQEEDWVSDIGLENGNLRYLHTEKQTNAAPTN